MININFVTCSYDSDSKLWSIDEGDTGAFRGTLYIDDVGNEYLTVITGFNVNILDQKIKIEIEEFIKPKDTDIFVSFETGHFLDKEIVIDKNKFCSSSSTDGIGVPMSVSHDENGELKEGYIPIYDFHTAAIVNPYIISPAQNYILTRKSELIGGGNV